MQREVVMSTARWMFALISASQSFICDTMHADLAAIPGSAGRFCAGIPEPRTQVAVAVMRSSLLELALRWGSERHAHLEDRCPRKACVPNALATVGNHWKAHGDDSKQAFTTWVAQLCRELERTHPERLAHRVAALISEDLSKPLNIPRISARVGAHEASIRRAFRLEFQTSPRRYQLIARVKRAEQLLRDEPEAKIESVALALGWRSKKNLYRAFRATRGATPGALRRASTPLSSLPLPRRCALVPVRS